MSLYFLIIIKSEHLLYCALYFTYLENHQLIAKNKPTIVKV
ncbi:hypothetical protein VCR5J5_1370153 [Vibrio crassostreae]|uniref:Uncharacterized protein n=1 Tax=Vibrio crassostreae TaxID=246167 RepID=A0A822MSW2_9VIBR|nr:hypothetical protein VCR5J5_1370153 [Vibrio crassostreae]CDT08276.1 hypothetical protein VCR15J5_30357 [Vibrio crassostreae]